LLKSYPLDQQIAKLVKLLADKADVTPEMEPALAAYRAKLQMELDRAKALAGKSTEHGTEWWSSNPDLDSNHT